MCIAIGIIGAAVVGAAATAYANQRNQAFASESGDKQMQFQAEMSNTAWQRGVKDMQAAGLNPMLAYSQGPASVPSGTSQWAQQQPMLTPNSAADVARAVADVKQGLAKEKETQANTAKLDVDTEASRANIGLLNAEANFKNSQATATDLDNTLRFPVALDKLKSEGVSSAAKAWGDQLEGEISKNLLDSGDWADLSTARVAGAQKQMAEAREAQLRLPKAQLG